LEATLSARQKFVQAAGLFLVALLALLLWETAHMFSGAVVSTEVRETVSPALHGELRHDVISFVTARKTLVSSILFMMGMLGLLIAMGFVYRAMDFLYSDSRYSAERSFTGFVLHLIFILGQLTLLYGVIHAAGGSRASLAPVLLACFLIINGVWMLLSYLLLHLDELEPMRGMWRTALVNLCFAAGLLMLLWFGSPDILMAGLGFDSLLNSTYVALTGLTMLIVFAINGYVQERTYRGPERVSSIRSVIEFLILLAVVSFGVYLFYGAR